MILAVDKQLVGRKFGKNISTYNQSAIVQKAVCQELMEHLKPLLPHKLGKVFEIGCGTGFLTQELLSYARPEKYYINDLTSEAEWAADRIFKQHKYTNWQFWPGDAENIQYPGNLDLIISTSTVQWFDDLDGFLERSYRALNKGRFLAFSTFGPENYNEIKRLLGESLSYHSFIDIQSKVEYYFEMQYSEENVYEHLFDTPLKVLRHIKSIGANGLSKQFWTKERLQRFEKEYAGNFSAKVDKVRLSYHPILIIGTHIPQPHR